MNITAVLFVVVLPMLSLWYLLNQLRPPKSQPSNPNLLKDAIMDAKTVRQLTLLKMKE